MGPRRLWQFPGGLHLAPHKEESLRLPLAPAALPSRIILPLQQHIGEPARPVVQVGQTVLKGEVIARPEGYVSVPLHASTSGRVVAIEDRPIPHPSGLSGRCIVIEPDGQERWTEFHPALDYAAEDPTVLRTRVREAGIVGLGGAGFPSFVKLNRSPDRPVEVLILNGAECEPYITCDDMLMRTWPDEVISGALIMCRIVDAPYCLVGVEDNKPAAIEALRGAVSERRLGDRVEIVEIPTRYPAGGEKQLIQVLTGKEVPSGGLPADIGIVCHNVGTAVAVHHAILGGRPLVSRVVTLTGGALDGPRNLQVLLGTPIADLLSHCGVVTERLERLIMGGPMMGVALHSDEVPVVKTTNCILAAATDDLTPPRPVLPCIRCGACAAACPVSLLPQQLYWYARAKDFDAVQDYHLFDCIECGCCAYVCPSNLPLVQYYRFAKSEIWALEREREKAELARRRFEFRAQRLEREKADRAARMAQKKAQLGAESDREAKKAAIQAAVARAEARRRERAEAAREEGEEQDARVD
jgi:H+/Na+-translocating ferredoxin:NAD+ oxidoreductase subunit C